LTGGLGCPKERGLWWWCPYGDGRSFEIILFSR
jgi:hypothetical protein